MPKVTLISSSEIVDALYRDPENPVSEGVVASGGISESERLGFDLGQIETYTGYLTLGIEALAVAKWLIRCLPKKKEAKIEISTPSGRIDLSIDGKSEEEVANLVKSIMPFTK